MAATLSDLNNDRAVDPAGDRLGPSAHLLCQPARGPVQVFTAFCRHQLPPTVGAVVLDFR